MKGLSVVVSFGEWGGIRVNGGFIKRVCLGWVSIILVPLDFDAMLYRIGKILIGKSEGGGE